MRHRHLHLLVPAMSCAIVLIATAVLGQSSPSPAFLTPPSSPTISDLLRSWEPDEPFNNEARIRLANFETQATPADGYLSPDWMDEASADVDFCPTCEACPRGGMYAFLGYDSWRGVQDDGWGNNGLHTGLNYGTRLGRISDQTGVGFQIGGSVGVYNWNGTDYHLAHQDQATTQGFVTYGFFRKPNEQSNWSGAVVQDWMITNNYGIFGQNPTMAQWRGQIGYATSAWNEFGLWGTWRGQGDSRVVNGFGPTRWRPVEQLSAYWHYKWGPGGADTWLSFGVPEHDRLAGGGSLGDYVVSAIANCPLSDQVLLYSQVTYMHPSSSPGPAGSGDEAWQFSIGLSFFPGRNARTDTVAGQCWMPQLPVANNGYFLVDTNRRY